jgi:hypothetical protein
MANDEIPNSKMYEIVDQTGYGKNEVQIVTPSDAVVEQAKYQLKRKSCKEETCTERKKVLLRERSLQNGKILFKKEKVEARVRRI